MTTKFKIITFMLYIAFLTTVDILLGNVLSTTKLECQIENVSRYKKCTRCSEKVMITYTYPIFNCSNTMETGYLSSDETEKIYKKLKSENIIGCYNTGQTDVCNLEISGKFNFVGRSNNNPSNILIYDITYIVLVIFLIFSALTIYNFIYVLYYFYKKKYTVDNFVGV